jgi:hypothetical protein
MDKISKEKLDAMKNVDIRTVDPDTLVDIHDVNVNTDLPKDKRILDFMQQIRNPYCFKCGDVMVKLTFAESEEVDPPTKEDTFEERFKNYLKSL